MKAFTDISQSKKLAEFLPLESADMEYMFLKENNSKVSNIAFVKDDDEPEWPDDSAYGFIPCWSLAALLSVLPKNLNIGRPSLDSNYMGYYWIQYYDEFMKPNNYKTECFNNPIDACYDMIIKLNGLNLL